MDPEEDDVVIDEDDVEYGEFEDEGPQVEGESA